MTVCLLTQCVRCECFSTGVTWAASIHPDCVPGLTDRSRLQCLTVARLRTCGQPGPWWSFLPRPLPPRVCTSNPKLSSPSTHHHRPGLQAPFQSEGFSLVPPLAPWLHSPALSSSIPVGNEISAVHTETRRSIPDIMRGDRGGGATSGERIRLRVGLRSF